MRALTLTASIFAAASMLVIATPASAQRKALREMDARLQQTEQSVAELKATVNGEAGPASTLIRIGQLEQEIQLLTGQVEQMSYKMDQMERRLDAISAVLAGEDPTLAAQLGASGGLPGPVGPQQLGQSGGAPVSIGPDGQPYVAEDSPFRAGGPGDQPASNDPIADQLARVDGASAASSGALPVDPNAAYDYASGFLLKGDYARAQEAFAAYLVAFPNHSRTADAQFRLGEIYLATGANAEAADAFIAHIRKYPNDARAAEAYLKLGTAFARLERPSEACKVLKTMKTKYPSAPQAAVQRANLEMSRIDCK